MTKEQSDFAKQGTPSRKSIASTKLFITDLAVLLFLGLALLFQFPDTEKKKPVRSETIKKNSSETVTAEISKNEISLVPPLPEKYSEKISGNINSIEVTTTDPPPPPVQLKDSVAPPLPLLDIRKQVVTVDAASGQRFTSSHHSEITIPSNAFLDKEGNIVNGKVDVSYREFYNHVDFFLSGIPMNNDNGSQLESAGMFELTASKDNEPLYVNPEKKINVLLSSLNRAPDYNLYYFDKQQNKWIDKGESKITEGSLFGGGFILGNTNRDTFEVKFVYQSQKKGFMQKQEASLEDESERFTKFQEDTTLYYANNPRYVEDEFTFASRAMRQFELDGFGIWNCDRIAEFPLAVSVNASFIDQNNNPLNPIYVYMADKSINSVFTYTQDMLKDFKFNPEGQNLVWAIFPGNIILVIKPKEFREKYAQSRQTCVFKVVVNTNPVLTKSEIKSQLAFDI